MLMDTAADRARLQDLSRALGLTLFGVADIRSVRDSFLLRPETVRNFDRALSLGLRLSDSVLDDLVDKPTPLYFHHYRQANNTLDRAALALSAEIQERGFKALAIAASQIIDWDRQLGHVPHKKVGCLAGLGWIGRNNLLISPAAGARFRLVTVLTDLPLEMDRPLDFACGTCRACEKVCPAGAIHDRPEDFDHQACYVQLQEFRKAGIVNQFICGLCVKACRGAKR